MQHRVNSSSEKHFQREMLNYIKTIAAIWALTSSLTSVTAVSDVDLAVPDFTGANWIWLPGPAPDGVTYPQGNASFRRDYYPPAGKTPLSANILMGADDAFTLFVNGRQIGTNANYLQAQRYCVPLVSGCNVFAVQGANVPAPPTPAGLVSAIEVRYTDGFTERVYTDAEWHVAPGSPAGFQQVAYDDSTWGAAHVEGPYGIPPWNKALAIPPLTQDPGPNLPAASFIWTNEIVNGAAPVGGRAFRKTVTLPAGKWADSLVVDISADDQYTLYVNGLLVGSDTVYTATKRFQVNFIPSNTVTIAVYAVNVGGPAEIIASGQIRGCVCGCGGDATFVTDSSWKFSTAVPAPAGFINPGFDDSKWPQAVVEGPYGSAPWGKLPIPTANSPQNAPIAGAPAAPPATVVV